MQDAVQLVVGNIMFPSHDDGFRVCASVSGESLSNDNHVERERPCF